MRFRLPVLLLLSISGCDRRRDEGTIVVSAIGATPGLADPAKRPLDTAQRLALDSVAQGLVRFDASGQIEPGLAERWIVTEGGLSYIFRLREVTWADRKPVIAADVARVLTAQIAAGSRNPLKPYLTAIDEVVAMTPRVIEVRLRRPRPDLLKLFAQPELALMRPGTLKGSGPFEAERARDGSLALRPAPDPNRDPDEEAGPAPEDAVQLIGERASQAVARFAARRSDLVTGGTLLDWPLVEEAGIAQPNIRTDPAAGLFGIAVVRRAGLLADAAGRIALAEATDPAAVFAALGIAATGGPAILPEALDSAASPVAPEWTALSPDARLAAARDTVGSWRKAHHDLPAEVTLALPDGPGATLLYASLARQWLAIGVRTRRVAVGATDADLRLIDVVAPYDSARWYLATACQPCGPEPSALLDQARDAPTMPLRAQSLAAADRAVAADASYIPIGRPLRWSLVAVRLGQWQGNARAWHPLNRLRLTPK